MLAAERRRPGAARGAHEEGYLVSQPGAMVPLHREALGVTGQVCQGVLVGREDGEGRD